MRHCGVIEGVGEVGARGLGWVTRLGSGYEARPGCEARVGLRGLGARGRGAVRERRVVKRVLPMGQACLLSVSRITVRLLACRSAAARSAVSGQASQTMTRAYTTQTKDAYERTEQSRTW